MSARNAQRRPAPDASTLNLHDPRIKQDILRMILQYLQDEGYTASFLTVQDEANVKLAEQQAQRAQLKRTRKAILEGDWNEVEKQCRRWAEDLSKMSSSQQRTFLYAVYRLQYLELIEGQEYQKAFTHLVGAVAVHPRASGAPVQHTTAPWRRRGGEHD